MELHNFGITVSYDKFKRFKASAATAAATKLIQSVGDNFDAHINSQNGLKQNHAMAVIMTQKEQ